MEHQYPKRRGEAVMNHGDTRALGKTEWERFSYACESTPRGHSRWTPGSLLQLDGIALRSLFSHEMPLRDFTSVPVTPW